jgi:hypothetical protein
MGAFYIILTFAAMLGLAAFLVGGIFALARGMWLSGLFGLFGALGMLIVLLDTIAGIEREFDRVTAQIELQS